MKMSIKKKLAIVAISFIVLVAVGIVCIVNVSVNKVNADSGFFAMDKIQLRIGDDDSYENSGIRFVVDFDDQTKDIIVNEAQEFGFLVAPAKIFNGVNDSYHTKLTKYQTIEYKKVNSDGENDFDRIYENDNADGFCANGVLEEIKGQNTDVLFTAVAYYKLNGGYVYADIPDGYFNSLQNLVSKDILDNKNDTQLIAKYTLLFNLVSENGKCLDPSKPSMAIAVNNKADFEKMLDGVNLKYELKKDIDFGEMLTPNLGMQEYYYEEFSKALEGNGHTIKFVVKDDNNRYSLGGLFNTFSGKMENVRIDGSFIGASGYNRSSGILARYLSGTVNNCIVIKNSRRTGSYYQGVFGELTSTAVFTNCIIQETANEFKTMLAFDADANAVIDNVYYVTKPFGFEIYLPNTVMKNMKNVYVFASVSEFCSNVCYYYLNNETYSDPSNTKTNGTSQYDTENWVEGNKFSGTVSENLGWNFKNVDGIIDFNK